MKKGFTLIELLVVIAIIGIISAIAVVNLSTTRGDAKLTQIEASMDNLVKAATICLQSSVAITCSSSAVACSGLSNPTGRPFPGMPICVGNSPDVGTWPDFTLDTRNRWTYEALASADTNAATFDFAVCESASGNVCTPGGKRVACTNRGCVTGNTP